MRQYPPDWNQAVAWAGDGGGYHVATVIGTDKPAVSFSDDKIAVVRTLVGDLDEEKTVTKALLIEFASSDPLDAASFADYVKQWYNQDSGDNKVLTAEYSLGYEGSQAYFYSPLDSVLKPASMSLKQFDKADKTARDERTICWYVLEDFGEICVSSDCGPRYEWVLTCVTIDIGGGDGGGGGGGGGGNGDGVGTGGGGDDSDDDNALRFSLSCDNTVTRGESAGCTVHVTGKSPEGEAYSASDFQFDWSSDLGASYKGSGSGGNEWRGTATATAEITVGVASESYSESASITVTARNVGSLPLLNARTVRYSGQPRSQRGEGTYGFYRIPDPPPGSVSQSTGSGPWAGQYMLDITLESSFYSELHVSHDYAANGPDWPLANATCTNSHSLPSSSSYSVVNYACGTAAAWSTFGAEIVAHEWEHEASFNACLGSQSATDMLENLEKTTGSVADVARARVRYWDKWWTDTWLDSGRSEGTSSGDPFYNYEGGGWTHAPDYPGLETDGGSRSGC